MDRGDEVVMACRNMNQCQQACDEITKGLHRSDLFVSSGSREMISGGSSGTSDIKGCCNCAFLDLADYESIRNFVSDIHHRFPNRPLSLLVNNAGTIQRESKAPANLSLLPSQTNHMNGSSNHEVHLQINHLGPFLLTRLLMPTMAVRGRIITVGSEAHRRAAPFFSMPKATNQGLTDCLISLMLPNWYKNYAQSKLGNNLTTIYINDELERRRSSVVASCVSPGRVQTAIFRDFKGLMGMVLNLVGQMSFQTPSQGASGVLKVASNDSIIKRRELDYVHCGKPWVASSAARDRVMAEKVWQWSLNAVNLSPKDDAVLWPPH